MIEDLKLELKALQYKDAEDAVRATKNIIKKRKDETLTDQKQIIKEEWLKIIEKKGKDEIAEAIIDISKRYDTPIENIAYFFDPVGLSMLYRVQAELKRKGATLKK